jgi:hypothetical protein
MLAGDAVHVHTPAGGQGMNTGMQDAHNLAWKLALVVSGRSPETLLNTYGEERAPVGADVLALTHGLVRIATVRNPFKRALRDVLVPLASRITPIQRRAVRRMSQVHLTYRSSSLTPPGSRSNGVRPGDRAPDAQVVEAGCRSRRLYEVLRSGRHVLVGTSVECPDELREWDSMFETVCGSHRSVCLIRPDGYVAASGIPGIKQYLRAVFAQPDAAPFVGESWRRGAVLLWGTGTSDR